MGVVVLILRFGGGILGTDEYNRVFKPLGYGVDEWIAEPNQFIKGNVHKEG